MRILYLCPDVGIPVLGRKGASVHVRELVTALGRAGHEVIVVAASLTGSPWEQPAPLDARVIHQPLGPETLAAARELKSFTSEVGVPSALHRELRRILYDRELGLALRREFATAPPDVIYERASLYATAGGVLARELGVPLLVELNAPLAVEQATYRATGFGALVAQAERWTLSHADGVLVVSAPLREHVLSLGVEPDRVHVLPNGVDPALFSPGPADPGTRRRWGLDEGPILGFVGSLRQWHGVEALPALLDRLLPRYPDLRLVIAGDGPLRADLAAGVRARGLGQRVIFTGALPHEEVPGLIRVFDVALAPYPRPDHAFYFSPLKLYEYMACGVPVVAAALGQILEVVRDGETGLLYPPDEPDALAAACDRLLADVPLRERLGQAAVEEVHGHYTWDVNAARVVELARSLAAQGPARGEAPGTNPARSEA